jgi:hypothetical protein
MKKGDIAPPFFGEFISFGHAGDFKEAAGMIINKR